MGGKIKVQQSLVTDPSVHDLSHQCSTTELCTTSARQPSLSSTSILYMEVELNASVNCRPDSHLYCVLSELQ